MPPTKFLTPIRMPASRPPFKMSRPALISPLLNVLAKASPIPEHASEILPPIVWTTLHIVCMISKKLSKLGILIFCVTIEKNSFIFNIAGVMKVVTFFTDFANTSVSFILSLRPLTQSPQEPVTSKMPSPNPVRFTTKSLTPPAIAFITVSPISRAAKNPLNVDFTFADCDSLSFKWLVNSLSDFVMLYKFLAVIGGNISLNASLTGFTTLANPSKAFRKASISSSLPPISFQPCNIELRASDWASMNPPNT